MSDTFTSYKRAETPIPTTHWLLPLYGQGFESLGRDGQPVQAPVPDFGPDELLVRHDAVGLCYSDVKVIRAGEGHPRLRGRDMRRQPVVLGHEVALTVVGVGENMRGQYAVGQRFIVQADIWYKGRNLAYGYLLQGGLSQYSVVGDEVLRGDHGCYLLPVRPETGYAEAALTEPWACVEAAYNIHYRQGLQPGGVAWFIGAEAAGDRGYGIGKGFDERAHPRKVLLTHVPPALRAGPQGEAFAAWLKERAAALGVEVVERQEVSADVEPVDDVIVLGPAGPGLIAPLWPLLARGGIVNLVSDEPLPQPVDVDVGRLHYDHITIVGNPGPDIAASYTPIRSTLKPEGTVWVLGAAGPMGHMHVQRAIQMTPRPRLLVATNLSSPRIADVATKYAASAQEQGIELVVMTEQVLGSQAFYARLQELTGGRGFDDIVVLAASPQAIEAATAYLAPGGVMNLFVGLSRGTIARLDLNAVRNGRQVRFVGSSGSSIEDMQRMIELAESGIISPAQSVAAVAGLAGAQEGLRAVSEGRFPGKIVIYPQIVGLELTPLPELKEKLPKVYARLEGGHTWTNEAEAELLRELLA
ncbi:MAG: zinc-binding dehydrogenase [Anaerolineae bacterium]|nr:zinc-binding dehydrogenase [Anaerolineae bacterium]